MTTTFLVIRKTCLAAGLLEQNILPTIFRVQADELHSQDVLKAFD